MTSNQQFVEHLTVAGERWDLLAWRYYGDPTLYSLIIMSNPLVSIDSVFAGGVTISIPVIEQSGLSTENLPPWKRSS